MFFPSSLSRGILRNIARPILSLSVLGMIGLGCMMLTPQIYAAPFDPISGGGLDTSFPGFQLAFNNDVYTLALQPDGKILAGGYFTTYNAVVANRLIRFNVDGTRDMTFTQTGVGLNESVKSILPQPDGKILVGGVFTTYDGISAPYLIRLNADGTRDSSFAQTGTGLNNWITSIALQPDGKILAGGYFTTYNGVAAPYLIRLNADGTHDTTFTQTGTGLNSSVHSLALQSDGKILAGGGFTAYNGVAKQGIIRLNADGSHDATFTQTGTGLLNPLVTTMVLLSNGKILAGGGFTAYNGVAKRGIIRLNADGSHDTTFNPGGAGTNSMVRTLVLQSDGKILVGGDFTTYNDITESKMIRLNADGTKDTTFSKSETVPDSSLYSLILQPDGKIVAGGRGVAAADFTRLNVDGTRDTNFHTGIGLNGNALSIAVQPDGKILVGGVFTNFNGISPRYVTRLNTDGTRDTNFQTGVGGNASVNILTLQPDGKILVGGTFTNFHGVSAKYLTRLNTDGTRDSSFAQTGTGLSAAVNTLALQPDGKILVGGTFTTYNGVAAPYLIRLNADGTRDSSFAQTGTGLSAQVRALALQPDGKILAGGNFTTYNSVTALRLIRLNVDGTRDTTLQGGVGLNGIVYNIALQSDGKILAGGNFTTFNSVAAPYLIRLNADGTRDSFFTQTGTGLSSFVRSLALQPDGKILAGGMFTTYNGTPAAYLTRIDGGTSFCSAVTDVPQEECEALKSIYDNTGGASWVNTLANDNKWGVSTTVNDWYGVDVWNGHVVGLGLQSNNLTGGFEITEGNLNSIQNINLESNHISSFLSTGLSSELTSLNLYWNELVTFEGSYIGGLQNLYLGWNQLTSFNGTGFPSLQVLVLYNNQLESFSGVGLSSIQSLYLDWNQLESFSGVGMSTLIHLTISANQLTSFNGTGLQNLQQLALQDNQLTSFNSTGLTSLRDLALNNNLISSFSENSVNLTPHELSENRDFTNNCLTRESLSIPIQNWLDSYAIDDWAVRNSSCPPLPSTMYFCGSYITDPTNWYQPDNWSGDVTCQSSAPKLRPDAVDNVIILANVAKNEVSPTTPAPRATVKTLQVKGDSVVSIPIMNGGGYTYTTNLAGDNNDITWTSSDPAVTITYATPVEQAETTVSVNGKNIIVTPGTKARMLVAGPLYIGPGATNPVNFPTLEFYEVDDEETFHWRNAGWEPGTFYGVAVDDDNENFPATLIRGVSWTAIAEWQGTGSAVWPDTTTNWVPTIQNNNGTPVITAVTSSASQVIAAVANYPAAAALVSGTMAGGNDGAGAVTAMSAKTISTPATTYATPMSFLGTSINAEFDTSTPAAIVAKTKNTLTGDVVFACTAQNLGSVTGNTTFTQCNATTAPTTTSLSTDNTPTFTGLCAPNTLVTLYNGTTALTPSVLCSIGGTYSITPTLSPGNYAITVKQSNRKGPTFGTSNASSPVLNHVIGCPEGQDWNGIACASTCTTTEAPTELKANVDKPYISCTDSNQGAQFKYRISDPNNPAFTPIISGAYSTGSRVLFDGVLSENIANNSTQHGSLDTTFSPTGANNLIWGMSRQPDERIIIGGGFTSYNGTSRNRIARLNSDGSLDTTFNPGTGANDYVEKTMLQSDGKIIIIGFFTTYNGTSRNRIARLNSDGSLDTTFNPGTGANDRITAVRIQSDGKIVIGGKFTTYNGTSRNRIARLNSDGSLDTTFDPGTGFTDVNTEISTIFQQSNGGLLVGGLLYAYNGSSRNGIVRIQDTGMIDSSFTLGTGSLQSVRYITQQPDGKIIIGGFFTSYGGVTRNRIARLNADGSLDTTFDPGVGAAGGQISVILQQPDGKIIIGGWFTSYGGVTRNRIARINLDGTLDTTFDPGSGANNAVYDVFQQPDGKIIIGGWFTSYNGVTRNSIARINAGGIPMGYKVECLYGDGTTFGSADTCTKTMVVRSSTAENEVQGCDRITNNFENFVGYEKWIHSTGFNASVSCFARKSDPEITDPEIPPFLLQYGTAFTPLNYLNSFLDIGRFTSEVDVHTFDSSLNTATTCAVRVGDGYSTNSLCQNLGCGGAECDAPSQYLIQPATNNLYCTREANAEYSIGCAPGDSYAGCIRNDIVGNLYHGLTLQTSGEHKDKYTKTWKFRLDADTTSPDTIRTIVCNSATPQTNENTALNCTVSLPTGRELGMLVATDPIDQYQVVRDIIPRDTEPPIAIIKEADDRTIISSGGKRLTAVNNQWLNKPVTVTITCQNEPLENNDTCTCSWLYQYEILDGNSTPPDSPSSSFMPHVPLRDIVDYKRVILGGEILNQLHVFFSDNANNSDQDLGVDISLGVDTRYPSVSLQTEASVSGVGNENKRRITLQATDNIGGSGLWGYGIRSVVINESGNINAVFDTECDLNISLPEGTTAYTSLPGINPVYVPFPETGDGFGPKSYGSVEYDITSQKIAYCVQDNAKNRLVGVYPFDPNMLIGCFSDGSQQFVPNLDIDNVDSRYYASLGNSLSLISRLTGGNPKYGYELTDPDKATSMADFRTKLAQNIETLVKQQYCPTTTNLANIVVNLEEKASTESPLQYAAKVKTDAGCDGDMNLIPRNTKGYYYFKGQGSGDIVDIDGVARLTGTKVLIVEGADIYLRDNIHYLSRESSLTIITIRSVGNGGNVYVDPKVTNIDATIIADGALMNGSPDGSSIDTKIWFNQTDATELQNPLVINGRLLTYNTRGGSLVANGNALEQQTIGGNVKCAVNTAPFVSTCTGTTNTEKLENAGRQDLERFRVVMRVPDELNNRCTLHVTGVSALNRPEILTRSGF